MSSKNKVDEIEKQKRIHQISLLLRRKPIKFIVEYIKNEWSLQTTQAYNYIKDARAEWQKYFSQVKKCGKSYYVTQLRDLKDQAYSRKVIIGRSENKNTVTIADLGLIFEITKEEAKLMGIYPNQAIDMKHSGEIDTKTKYIVEMGEGELDKFIKVLIEGKAKVNGGVSREKEKGDKS